MIVEVTQEDIEQGVPGAPSACPVALAIRRLPGWEDVIVTGLSAYRGVTLRQEAKVELSLSAKQFISKFDGRKPVKPFRFRL